MVCTCIKELLYLLPCRHQAILSVVVGQPHRLRPGDSLEYGLLRPLASPSLCAHHTLPLLGGQGAGLICSETGLWSPSSSRVCSWNSYHRVLCVVTMTNGSSEKNCLDLYEVHVHNCPNKSMFGVSYRRYEMIWRTAC